MKRIALLALLSAAAFGQSESAPATPMITWTAPVDIRTPASLTAVQLNAAATVPGTFVYTPDLGAVLPSGAGQTLSVTFTPTDEIAFTTTTATVQITVLEEWEPYAIPEPVTVCQMDTTQTAPAVDGVTGYPRCFVVPVEVSASMTKFLLTQTEGLGVNGKVAYKYASWWDYVVKFFINQMVMPVLDSFPPAGLAAAKASAASAASAVDAAKAAILTGRQ